MFRLRTLFAAIAALVFVATSASAKVGCSLTTTYNSRPLFTNAGVYASKKTAQISDLYCADAQSGLYFDVWNLMPFGPYVDGGEVDVRVGWTKRFGQLTLDGSVAEYDFHIRGLGQVDSFDGRFKATYDVLDSSSTFVLQPYVLLDYQKLLQGDLGYGDALALAGGAYAGVKLAPQVELGVTAGMWAYQYMWAPNHHATIRLIEPIVKLQARKDLAFFFKVPITYGTIADPTDHQWRKSAVLGFTWSF